MKVVEFIPQHQEEFKILRDYYVETKEFTGLKLILGNEKSGQVFTARLKDTRLTDIEEWEKAKKSDVDYQSFVIEVGGKSSKLILETGIAIVEKRFTKKEKEYQAKRYRYILGSK